MAVSRAAADVTSTQTAAEQKTGAEEQKLVSQLTNLIPAEALAGFVAAMAAAAHSGYHVRMFLFWMILVLTPMWIVGNYWLAAKGGAARHWPLLQMFVGTVAFVAWSLTVPGTPFEEHLLFISSEGLSVQNGAWITLATSIILGFIAQVGVPAWKAHQEAKKT
jgi:hypothetical protein